MIDPEDQKVLKRWFSIGDILTVAAMVAAIAVSHGQLSARVASLTAAVEELQQRNITPGAAQRLESLEARDIARQRELDAMRSDAAEFRRDMREALARIEAKLDNHDRRD